MQVTGQHVAIAIISGCTTVAVAFIKAAANVAVAWIQASHQGQPPSSKEIEPPDP